jgi:hypothetical protein
MPRVSNLLRSHKLIELYAMPRVSNLLRSNKLIELYAKFRAPNFARSNKYTSTPHPKIPFQLSFIDLRFAIS